MNICHLYYSVSSSIIVGDILDAFDESISIDISKTKIVEQYNIYIIEVIKIDKNVSAKLLKIFKSKSNCLIYFLISKEYNLMLFQTAFMLNAKTIITQSQDIKKVISKIQADFIANEDEHVQKLLGKTLLKNQELMIFKNHKLIFASEKLFDVFSCNNLDEINNTICSQLNIDELLSQDTVLKQSLIIDNQIDLSFDIRSTSVNNHGETILNFQRHITDNKSEDKLSFILNKLSFIEILKEKIQNKSTPVKSYSIISIEIDNIKMLQSELNEVELEDLIKQLLFKVDIILDKKIVFAQYGKEFYVALFEDIEFNELKKLALEYHNKIYDLCKDDKYRPMIGLFVFNIDKLDLNEVLTKLSHIENRSLSKDDIESDYFEYINNIDEDMSEKDAIAVTLESVFTNRVEFKLLNIYKGLFINTPSKIIKIKDETIYVQVEMLQAIIMKNDRQTILQSSGFTKDVQASVKYIDLNKNIAILENFKFLNSNVKARKFSRVTCSSRTPIIAALPNGTISGEIIDLSMHSIAIKTKRSKITDNVHEKDVVLTFMLPTDSTIDGFIKLNLKANVAFLLCEEDSCKMVCDLYKDEDNESVFMEYVYKRQKEIIVEVKKMAKRA